MEVDIISQNQNQNNPKIRFFNDIVEKWLSESLNLEIEINLRDAEIFSKAVWDNFQYEPLDLMNTFNNLLKMDEKSYIFPMNDENLKYLFNRYANLLNYSSIELGDGDSSSIKLKVFYT